MKNGNFMEKAVKGLIAFGFTAVGVLVASCVKNKDNVIEAGSGEEAAVEFEVKDAEETTEEVEKD